MQMDVKTFVLGVGSPYLSDDSAGLWAVKSLQEKVSDPSVTIDESTGDWLGLLDQAAGYDRLILIDAIQTETGTPGEVYRLSPDAFVSRGAVSMPHNVSLTSALELGRRMNMKLPQTIIIYAIEAADTTTFCEQCTPAVAAAVDEVVRAVLCDLAN